MARVKGATRTDQAAHLVFDNIRTFSGGTNNGGQCPQCSTALLTAYHEERLYSVHCPFCRTVTLVEATNPSAAEALTYLAHSQMEG